MSDPQGDRHDDDTAGEQAILTNPQTGLTDDSSVGFGNRPNDLDTDADTERTDEDAEPSLQRHHDAETEEDTASGGAP